MEEENLYDEFGNYIGPQLDMSEDEDDSENDAGSSPNRSPAASGSDYAYEKVGDDVSTQNQIGV